MLFRLKRFQRPEPWLAWKRSEAMVEQMKLSVAFTRNPKVCCGALTPWDYSTASACPSVTSGSSSERSLPSSSSR